jgi:putative hydrolase of the HAD superfamily
VKAVIFDFYNTLAESPAWGPSWQEMVAGIGFELPPEVQDRWWNDGVDGIEHDEHSQSRDHYVAWQQARLRGMLTECGVPPDGQDRLIEQAREIGGHRHITAYDETRSVLADLRARGITLAICSNWDWDLEEAIEAAGLTGTVDVALSSAWVGARKPHRRMYEAVLDEINRLDGIDVAPADALFVGDTWTCDVEGPRAVGLVPLYLRRAHLGVDKTAPDDHHAQDVHRAEDLRMVLDVVS